MAYNAPKPETFFYPIPTSRPGAGRSSNAASAASLFMQCILAATFCAEGDMPPTPSPSGPPGMSQGIGSLGRSLVAGEGSGCGTAT
jgi:hypothetical protein